ncbi:MAG TPA: phage/plasmid primase, P4 family [Stellaceae bacterium]|nr:phage/plasmid primase, P4 family [Stellaceae bacterium]
MSDVIADTAAAVDFLRRFAPDGPWTLTAIIPNGYTETRTFALDAEKECAAWIDRHQGERNIYFSVNPLRRAMSKKAEKADVAALAAIHVDLDDKDFGSREEVWASLRKLPDELRPSVIIESGGGLQFFWRLAKPAPVNGSVDPLEAYNKAIGKLLGADHCFNIDRIMRLPGTVNVPDKKKRDAGRTPVLARLHSFEDRTFELSSFDVFLPRATPSTTTPARNGSTAPPRRADVDALPVSDRIKDLIRGVDDPAHPYKSRSERVFAVISALVAEGCADGVALSVLLDPSLPISAHVLEQPRPREYAERQIARAAESATTRAAEAAPFTEEALALRFAEEHVGDLRYVALWGKWLEWDGTRWRAEETLHAFDLARAICRDASAAANKPKIKAVLASAKTVAAVERLAKADRRLAATAEQWDADPWLLNTPDGTVDLKTGRTRAHRREDHMTKVTAVAPGGDCPLWLAFVERITGGDAALALFLQRVAGYALTGSTQEQALFFGHGTGANGKTVFVNTIRGIMGDYATTAPMETFVASYNDHHPTDLADLRGARLVTATETEEGRRWAESRIKQMTGGDPIKARFMRQDFFEYEPVFKLFIIGNHKPGLRGIDEAIRRRMNLIPFTVTIPEGERDERLAENLRAEWPGILAWMIEGCAEWQGEGLAQPEVVRRATADYLEAEDALGQWIADRCEIGPSLYATTGELWRSWRQWAEAAEERPGSQKKFSMRLADRDGGRFRKERAEGTQLRGFRGIGLKPEAGGGGVDDGPF